MKRELVCRERSYAQIDIANFWDDTKLGLCEACCMFLIYVQLGFLVGESINYMVPSFSVHVAVVSVKATVRCPHWCCYV